jgi:urease subunit alpha
MMFGGYGKATQSTSFTFMSKAAIEAGVGESLALNKQIAPVKNTRNLGKVDMVLNDYLPNIEVDPETYEVRVDGEIINCEPLAELPMTQRYFLF